MLLQLAIGGAGILRLSEHVVAPSIHEGLLQPLLQDAQDPETYLRKQGKCRGSDANQAERRAIRRAGLHLATPRIDGAARQEAAKIGGMDRQTLRDWVIRFNEQGPDGLINKASPGRAGQADK